VTRGAPVVGGDLYRAVAVDWVRDHGPFDLMTTVTCDQARRLAMLRSLPPGTQRHGQRYREPTDAPMTTDTFARLFDRGTRDLERSIGQRVVAWTCLEWQRNGWPHSHSVMRFERFDPDATYRAVIAAYTPLLGRVDVQRPRGQHDVSAYVVKYMLKADAGALRVHPATGNVRRYLRPTVTG